MSLWVGRAESEDALWDELEVSFSDDGDFLGSGFSRAFEIEYYEDSTREAEYFAEAPPSLADMLTGASYEEVILPRFEDAGATLPAGANVLILLYNYRHTGPRTVTLPGLSLQYLAAVAYC